MGLIIAGEVVKDLTKRRHPGKGEDGRKSMKTITIEELEQLTPGSVTIVDVRPQIRIREEPSREPSMFP